MQCLILGKHSSNTAKIKHVVFGFGHNNFLGGLRLDELLFYPHNKGNVFGRVSYVFELD